MIGPVTQRKATICLRVQNTHLRRDAKFGIALDILELHGLPFHPGLRYAYHGVDAQIARKAPRSYLVPVSCRSAAR